MLESKLDVLDSLAVDCRFEPAVGGTSEALRPTRPISDGLGGTTRGKLLVGDLLLPALLHVDHKCTIDPQDSQLCELGRVEQCPPIAHYQLERRPPTPVAGAAGHSRCSARDSTDIDFNGQRNGQLHSARRSVEDRLTAIRRRADNCPCAVWQPAPSVAGRQRWGIRAGRERRLAIRSRRAHKAIIIIAAEGRIQPVRHSTRYL